MKIDETVSIVIPVYNGEIFIGKCLDSVLCQTYTNIQIIIVNDGSTDNTKIICERYLEKDNRVVLVNKENQGLLSARLTGIINSNSEYIAFIDADDWYDIDFIETMMKNMEDCDLICSNALHIYDNYTELEKNTVEFKDYTTIDEITNLYGKMMFDAKKGKFGILPYAWNKIFKKEILLPILEKIDKNIFDGEDVAFTYPYLLQCKKIKVIDYCGYNYLYRKVSLSHNKYEQIYYNESCLYKWLYEIFRKSEYYDIMLPQLNEYILMMFWKRNPQSFIRANKFVFPYSQININEKIIIYGDGDVGKAYQEQIAQSNYCEIVAIADRMYENSDYEKKISPKDISCKQYEHVVIAVADTKLAKKIYEQLIEYNVPKDKIIM